MIFLLSGTFRQIVPEHHFCAKANIRYNYKVTTNIFHSLSHTTQSHTWFQNGTVIEPFSIVFDTDIKNIIGDE